MNYQLRWGDRTGLYALLMALISGTFIVWLAFEPAEAATKNGFFFQYYSPLLGYFVVAAICQSHYFRTSGMKLENSIRYFVSIGAATVLFATNQLTFYLIGIAPTEYMHAHFLWILFGFYMFGFDDFLFAGKLSKLPAKLTRHPGMLSRFLDHTSFKAAIWYVVIWILWGIMVVMGTIHKGSDFNYFAGHFQWAVILLLMCALQLKEVIPAVPMKNDYIRGASWYMFTIVGGFIIGEILFRVNAHFYQGLDNGHNWHHVLYQGTYPLFPIIILGLYTNHLGHIRNIYRRAALRSAVVGVSSIILYFFFHAVLMNTGLFDVSGAWTERIDLYWNFTVSIIPLTWAWFCARWGFMRPVTPVRENIP